MYSCGPPLMDVQEWDDQHELTYSSYVRTRDVTLKTCRRRWMIGRDGERRSGISAQAVRHDDDDEVSKINGQISFIPFVMGPLPTYWSTLPNPIITESQVLSLGWMVRDWIFDCVVSKAYATILLCILLHQYTSLNLYRVPSYFFEVPNWVHITFLYQLQITRSIDIYFNFYKHLVIFCKTRKIILLFKIF